MTRSPTTRTSLSKVRHTFEAQVSMRIVWSAMASRFPGRFLSRQCLDQCFCRLRLRPY
jgi:hypothetical protein